MARTIEAIFLVLLVLLFGILLFYSVGLTTDGVDEEVDSFGEDSADYFQIPSSSSTQSDIDKDDVPDLEDNCPEYYNPEQLDRDWDGVGDVCDIKKGSGSDKKSDDECDSDSDCGEDGYVGEYSCSGDNRVRDYETFTCDDGECDSDIEEVIVEECAFGCVDGNCVIPDCDEDSDCDDSDDYTYDVCVNPGTDDSYCSYEDILCIENSDCGDSGLVGEEFCSRDDVVRLFELWTCENPGTVESACSSGLDEQLIEVCGDYCSDGVCEEFICEDDSDCDDSDAYTKDTCYLDSTVDSYCGYEDILCILDSDCGVDGFVGDLFCSGDDVMRMFKMFTCNGAGTVGSTCSYSEIPATMEECADVCVDGSCGDVECYNDTDCDDSEDYTEDICYLNGTADSYCGHEDIL